MAQNDTRSLVLDLINQSERLKKVEELLKIGMEQLDGDNEKSVSRLILLVEVSMAYLNCSIEEISFGLRELRQTSAFKQADKL